MKPPPPEDPRYTKPGFPAGPAILLLLGSAIFVILILVAANIGVRL